ncbi:Tankyrase-1 [Colletotrichum shisoi]|uniref:Tankyrase-1 n=1 Tax=Colletotrichum shisoi TaxID=2078593 RepID=A0A5Q4BWN0_9PEZI|nr:Tankyrase-1 [Colletotrichum shisoi]
MGSAELRESTQFIDYTLRICGQSPETSHPSILVFCRQRDFKPLHGLLSNDRLRFQYCRKRSSRRDLWSGWPASRRSATATDQNVPLFDLYFWRSLQPRELLWGPRSTLFLDQGPSTGIASYLTMCGSTLVPSTDTTKRITLAYVLQLGLDYYGVTASHVFRRAGDGQDTTVPREELPNHDGLVVSIEESDTVPVSGELIRSDHSIGQQTETMDTEAPDYGEEYFTDDGEYESFTDEESDTEDTVGATESEKAVWHPNRGKIEAHAISFPQLSEHEVVGGIDLDWALVKLEDQDNWRPNAIMAKNRTDVVFLEEFVSEYPERETPVLIVTSDGSQFPGKLHSVPSMLGGVNGKVPSVMRTITLDNEKYLVKGDSGSVVVQTLTNQIFGHVVASNPLGEVYVSPVIGLMKHLKYRYHETQVRPPQPLSTLRGLVSFHALRKNAALVDRLTPHMNKLAEDARESAPPLSELLKAARNGDVEVVKSLVQRGACVDEKDHDGATAMHFASDYGHTEMVNLLVESGANLDSMDDEGWTPLNDASFYGHVEVVRLLLSKGADLTKSNIFAQTPLHYAAQQGHQNSCFSSKELG